MKDNKKLTHSRQALNKNPKFNAPQHHTKIPGVLLRWMNWTAEKPLHQWQGFALLKAAGIRKRSLYQDRQKSLAAVTQAILHHLNLCTHDVHASIEQIAELCELSTVSNGNKNITRVSRLFTQVLEPCGLVECEKVWDKFSGLWTPKHIRVTPLFFEFLGLEYSIVEQEQVKRQAYTQKQLIDEHDAGLMTISDLQKLAKRRHFINAFNWRKEKRAKAKRDRLAKKVKAEKESLKSTAHSKIFSEIALQVANEYKSLHNKLIDFSELKKLTNQRIAYYHKIAET